MDKLLTILKIITYYYYYYYRFDWEKQRQRRYNDTLTKNMVALQCASQEKSLERLILSDFALFGFFF